MDLREQADKQAINHLIRIQSSRLPSRNVGWKVMLMWKHDRQSVGEVSSSQQHALRFHADWAMATCSIGNFRQEPLVPEHASEKVHRIGQLHDVRAVRMMNDGRGVGHLDI